MQVVVTVLGPWGAKGEQSSGLRAAVQCGYLRPGEAENAEGLGLVKGAKRSEAALAEPRTAAHVESPA